MSRQKGLAPVYLVLTVLVIGILLLAVNSQSDKGTDQEVKGTLIAHGDDSSLGSSGSSKSDDDKDDDKSSTSGSSGSGSSGSTTSTPKPASTPKLQSQEDKSEVKDSGVKVKTEEKGGETRSKIRLSETERIKTKVEEGKTKIEVTQGGVKVKFVIKDGKVKIKAETEGEGDVDDQTLFKIEQRLDRAGIKVATAGGKLVVARGNIGALSNFPLQIDLNTNQLIASTSAGPRVLTVLPDVAVQNMLAANVISRLGPPAIRQAVQTGTVTSVADVVKLGEINGVPVYEINGLRDFRLLNFIPITLPVQVSVSAQTGEVVDQSQSVITRIVDFLSP